MGILIDGTRCTIDEVKTAHPNHKVLYVNGYAAAHTLPAWFYDQRPGGKLTTGGHQYQWPKD